MSKFSSLLLLFIGLSSAIDLRCYEPIDSGLCYGYMPMYAYNITSRKCTEFIYGGCGGNDNRFGTLEDCKAACEGAC